MRLKVDPERSLTAMVAGKTRYNFIEMITSEKKKQFFLFWFFSWLILSNTFMEWTSLNVFLKNQAVLTGGNG